MGKPLMFKTPEMMEDLIDDYFDITPEDEITITGLALHLGTSRRVLLDYEERPDYKVIVQNAKCRVEHSYEKSLRKSGRSGDIFALKNFGWQDKSTLEHEGGVPVTKIERTIVEPHNKD